jgi:hypothetical protein
MSLRRKIYEETKNTFLFKTGHNVPQKPKTSQLTGKAAIPEFSRWIRRYIDKKQGWTPYLLTFMFKPRLGGDKAIKSMMADEVDRVYSTFVTHVVRCPRYQSKNERRPFLLAVPDGPGGKRNKNHLSDISINNGLHLHAILLIPPKSRLRRGVEDQFERYKSAFVRNMVLRIDVQRIETNLDEVVDYACKGLRNGCATLGDVIILPRSRGEC